MLVESLWAPEDLVALCAGSRVFDAGVLGPTSSSFEAFVARSTRKWCELGHDGGPMVVGTNS